MTFIHDHLALLVIALLLPVVMLPIDVLVPLAALGILGAGLVAAVDWARRDDFGAHHRADALPDDLPRDLWPGRH